MKNIVFILLLMSCNSIIGTNRSSKSNKTVTKNYKKTVDTIPFELGQGWILINAEIGEKVGTYIFDNCARTNLDYYNIERKGVKTTPKRIDTLHIDNWRMIREPYQNKIEEIKISNSKWENIDAGTISFSVFTTFSHCKKIQGIIGSNIANQNIWQINYEKNEIYYTDKLKKLNINSSDILKFKIKKLEKYGYPIIELPITPSLTADALIDLGNSSITIIASNNADIESRIFNKQQLETIETSTIMKGPYPPRAITSEKLVIGKLKTELINKKAINVGYNLKLSTREVKELSYFDLVLGYDFLKNFNITFDWPNEMVYFEPIEQEIEKEPKKEAYNFNIDFFNYDKKVYVMGVFPNHCDTTLVSVGDTVKAINGTPIEEIVGGNYCEFILGEKSLLPKTDEPIKILLKDKNGKEKEAEMHKVQLFKD